MDKKYNMNYERLVNIMSQEKNLTMEQRILIKDYAINVCQNYSRYACPRGIHVVQLMNYMIHPEKLRILFNSTKLCKCCERHMSNSPCDINSSEITPLNITFHKNCDCACRHSARIYKRAYDFMEEPLQYSDDDTISANSDTDEE